MWDILGHLAIFAITFVGIVYATRTDVNNMKKWVAEHKEETRVGQERLRAVENLTTEIATLVKGQEKRLDRLEAHEDRGL